MTNIDPVFEEHSKNITNIIKSIFPIKEGNREIQLNSINIPDELEDEDLKNQQDILLEDKTWGNPINATLTLKEGGVIKERKTINLATLPKMTPRVDWIVGGSPYQIFRQMRLKPSSYTVKQDNGEVVSKFIFLPEDRTPNINILEDKGILKFNIRNKNVPLYNVLTMLGVSDDEMSRVWGKERFDINKEYGVKRIENTLPDLYETLFFKKPEGKIEKTKKEILDKISSVGVDADVTNNNLGVKQNHLSPSLILESSRKLLDVRSGKLKPDEKDNLLNKYIFTPEDLLQDRMTRLSSKIKRDISYRLKNRDSIREVIPYKIFNNPIEGFYTTTDMSSISDGTNPINSLEGWSRITSLGEGAISDIRAAPEISREVHPSYFGFIDSIHTPESLKIGLTNHLSLGTNIKNKTLVKSVYKNGKKVEIAFPEFYNSIVALDEKKDKDGNIDALHKGERIKIKPKEADYFIGSPIDLFSSSLNIVPFLNHNQGNRMIVAGKMIGQSLPLVNRESPMIQHPIEDTTLEKVLAALPESPVKGVVDKIDDDEIVVKDNKGKKHKVGMYNYFPMASSVYLKNYPKVKEGDKVEEGQLLAESNFSQDGTLSLGTHLTTALMPFKGLSHQDALVISESAANKLSSEHMYKFSIPREDNIVFNLKKFKAYYPDRLTEEKSLKLDEDGIILPGQSVDPGDIISAKLRKIEILPDEVKLGKLSKSLVRPLREDADVFDIDFKGQVHKVVKKKNSIDIYIRTSEPMRLGDKMCYDDQTYILTMDGWKLFKDLIPNDLIATLNPRNHRLEYQNPLRFFMYDYNGKMYKIINQQVDLLVSPNHNMYVKPRDKLKFDLYKIDEIYGKRVEYKKNAVWIGEDRKYFELPELKTYRDQHNKPILKIDMDLWMEFLGYYISEGSSNLYKGNYRITISQSISSNYEKYNKIKNCLKKLSFNFCEIEDGFNFQDKQLYLYLHPLGKSWQKYIPSDIKNLSSKYLKILFDALILGDGCISKNGSISYFSSSLKLIRDIQEICLKIGYSGNIEDRTEVQKKRIHFLRGEIIRSIHPSYILHINRNKNTPQVNHGHVKSQKIQEEKWVDYNGKIYSCEVPNHIIYVMRDGKPVWSGNSGLAGNKSIVSAILPENQMPKMKDGTPVQVLVNPLSIPSRNLSGQILEIVANKVAQKSGKTLEIGNFEPDVYDKLNASLKKLGITDKEELINPDTDKPYENKILVGPQYFSKLRHQVATKFSSRELGGAYDTNLAPLSGNEGGSKALDALSMYAMLAHGSNKNLKEMFTWKSNKDPAFWHAIETGSPLPKPKPTFAFQKFLGMLNGLGIDVSQKDNQFFLSPLTDEKILEQSSGEIKNPEKIIKGWKMDPEDEGLMDVWKAGGMKGQKLTHFKLAEPVPNPVFKNGIKSLLNLTDSKYIEILKGDLELDGKTGGEAIEKALSKIDIDKELKESESAIKSVSGNELDRLHKKIKYLKTLKEFKLDPTVYVLHNIPVMPPVFRQIYPLPRGNIFLNDINMAYKNLGLANKKLKELSGKVEDKDIKDLRYKLYNGVEALMGVTGSEPLGFVPYKGILDVLAGDTPKEGLVQSSLIRKQLELTGRATITSDPTKRIDEIGLPEDMAWNLYTPFIIKRLRGMGYGLSESKQKILDKEDVAKKALINEMSSHPVLLNRAPSLHKFSVMAFIPKLTSGKHIEMSHLPMLGMNADSLSKNTIINYWKNGEIITDYFENFPRIEESKITKKHIDYYKVPENIMALTINPSTLLFEWQPVDFLSVHHNLNMVEITTNRKTKCIATPTHSFITIDENYNLVDNGEKLEIGSLICKNKYFKFPTTIKEIDISKYTTIPVDSHRYNIKKNIKLDKDFGYFLGAFIGDAWVDSNHKGIHLANTDINLQKSYKNSIINFSNGVINNFNKTKHPHKFGEHDCYSEKINFQNIILQNFLKWVYFSPDEFKYGLISGLLDTDGSIHINRKQTPIRISIIILNTINEVLAYQTLFLLKSLNIDSCVRESKNGDGKKYYTVNLIGDIKYLEDKIKLHHSIKKDHWNFCINLNRNFKFNDRNIVPLFGELRNYISTLYKSPTSPYTILRRKNNYITEGFAKKILEEYRSEILKHKHGNKWISIVENENLGWEIIKNIYKSEENIGYDLTLNNQNFGIANGLQSKNTDGDSLTVHVPATQGAIKESFKMLPSKSLRSPGTGELMLYPQHESLLGLYFLSKEPEGRKELSKLIGIKIDESLTKKKLLSVLGELEKSNPKKYIDIIDDLKELGYKHITNMGYTLGMEEIKPFIKNRDSILKNFTSQNANDISRLAEEEILKSNPNNFLVEAARAGARGKISDVRKMIFSPIVSTNEYNEVMAYPIRHSYAEGLTLREYLDSSFSVRRGAISRSREVIDPGWTNKKLMASTADVIITDKEIPDEGIELETSHPDVVDRFVAQPIKVGTRTIPRNTLITEDLVRSLKKNKINSLFVRSPLSSQSNVLIPQKSFGLDESGNLPKAGTNIGIIASSSLTEPLTQMTLNKFHQNIAEYAPTGGYEEVARLLDLPKTLEHKSELSPESGKIGNIKKTELGYKVDINNKLHNFLTILPLKVKKGDNVLAGDQITEGKISPTELIKYKGLKDTQKYLVNQLEKTYHDSGIPLKRRYIETVVQKITDLGKVEESGDSDYIPGDRAPITSMDALNKDFKNKIKYSPELRGINVFPLMSEDWIARLNFGHLKRTLSEGSLRGWSSNLKSTHPVTNLIYGISGMDDPEE